MFLIILFMTIQIEGDYYIQLNHTSSSTNLFFLDRGFLNPAEATGIIGADINPAVLASSGNLDFFTGFSFAGKSSTTLEDSFDVGGVEESIYVPFDFGYSEMGGMDFIGISKRIGRFGIGVSLARGYKWGLEMGLNGSIQGDFHPEEPFKLTHSDHPDIPDGDTIVVDIPFNGGISVECADPFKIEYSSSPIFVGAGTGIGPIKIGAGLKFSRNKLHGSGNIAVIPDTFSVSVDTTVEGSLGDMWVVDVAGTAFINDTLFYGTLQGDIEATQTAVNVGLLLDAKILKVSLVYEFGNGFGLLGEYGWLFTQIAELPDSFDIDTTGMNVDTVNHQITGNVGITISDLQKKVNQEIGDANLQFVGYHSLKAALLLKIPGIKLGINGAIDLPASNELNIQRISAGVFLGLPVPVLDVSFGVAGSILWLNTESPDIEDIFIPSATVGLSVGYKHDNFRIAIPLKMNITQVLLGTMTKLEEEEFTFDFWENINFGIGIGISL